MYPPASKFLAAVPMNRSLFVADNVESASTPTIIAVDELEADNVVSATVVFPPAIGNTIEALFAIALSVLIFAASPESVPVEASNPPVYHVSIPEVPYVLASPIAALLCCPPDHRVIS